MMALHRDIRFPKLRVLNMAQVNRGTLASDHDGDNHERDNHERDN